MAGSGGPEKTWVNGRFRQDLMPDRAREMTSTVAFVLKGYPRLSETFIAQEILALEKKGIDIALYSLRHPTSNKRHPVHDEIKAIPKYLPEYVYQEPLRVWRAWRAVRRLPGYLSARSVWLADLARDRTPNRIRRFAQALVLAHELPANVTRIHAHFLHTPGSVARYGAMIMGLPWSCSAHAKDIWTLDDWEKREKLADCDWLVTCTRANVDHLSALAPDTGRVELVYHGLDFSRFPERNMDWSNRDGRQADDPVVLFSVGRAVDKKGFAGVLAALRQLPASLHWRFVHIGDGPLLPALKGQAERDGLADRITWMGGQAHSEVLHQCRQSDIFVLNSRISSDGDRDGLPNVLMEAQSQGVVCLSTRISAIPELIEDGETGCLVPADNDQALATELQKLIEEPDLRRQMGEAGMNLVRTRFSMENGINHLPRKFTNLVKN